MIVIAATHYEHQAGCTYVLANTTTTDPYYVVQAGTDRRVVSQYHCEVLGLIRVTLDDGSTIVFDPTTPYREEY